MQEQNQAVKITEKKSERWLLYYLIGLLLSTLFVSNVIFSGPSDRFGYIIISFILGVGAGVMFAGGFYEHQKLKSSEGK
jgi:hypothetical protein